MSELLVIGYDNTHKAEEARKTLFSLSKDYLLEIKDVVIAEANEKGEIKLNQMVNTWAVGASGGAFWGVLVGIIFFNPLLGLATGAAAGGIAGALSDYGINDKFMKEVAGILQPGQAALFLMADRATSDKVIEPLSENGGRVIRTNLDSTQEEKLRAAFAKHANPTHDADSQAA